MPAKPRAFATAADFRRWLEQHHDSAPELVVRLFKTKASHRGMGYKAALDEALAFGWIDGHVKRLDDDHIASSRDLDFKQKFLEVTGGLGLDVVLDSLARETQTWRAQVGYRDMLERPIATSATWNLAKAEPVLIDNLPATRGRARTIAWDLRFGGGAGPFHLFPSEALYEIEAFPRTKQVTPWPDARFDGRVVVDGREWKIESWRGMQGHNWGRGHALRYAWAQVNAFADAPGTFFEGTSAQLKADL